MGPAQMLHQRIYDADVCLRQSGDADGGGAVHIQKVVRGYVEDTGQFHNVLRGGSGYAISHAFTLARVMLSLRASSACVIWFPPAGLDASATVLPPPCGLW